MLTAAALLLLPRVVPAVSSDVAAVVAVLETNAGSERMADELVRLGPGEAPDLFWVLAYGGGLSLTPDQESALVEALSSLHLETVRSLLRQRLAGDPPSEERDAALRVLARSGTSEDFLLVRMAGEDAAPGLLGTIEATCTSLLQRDPRALGALRRWMVEAPPETAAALVRALGASGLPEALDMLSLALGTDPALDAALLEEIGPLAARAPKPLADEILAPIDAVLQGGDPELLRLAALALGHARHEGALARLIELIEHEDEDVRSAARWALGKISGLSFGGDAPRWRAWLQAETAWLARERPRLLADLRSASAEVVIRALGVVSTRRCGRHELALEASAALEHESPLVRRLGCLALARLGSSAAGPALKDLLHDEDESVAEAARLALEKLDLWPGELAVEA